MNLGGWLVLEPFISPALYQKYPGTVDEWTLSEAMAADTAGGGLDQIEEHYKTFIVSSSYFTGVRSDRFLIVASRPRRTLLRLLVLV